MKKLIVNFICCFIPLRGVRHWVRRCFGVGGPKNNVIEIVRSDGRHVRVKRIRGCKFLFRGDNNHVVLYEPLGDLRLDVDVCNNMFIEIKGADTWLRSLLVRKGYDNEVSRLIIGERFKTSGQVRFIFSPGAGDIIIGDDCMLSWDVRFWTGDSHVMYDCDTGMVLNFNRDVKIGNHVWIGEAVMFMKGAVVADNCIIGARSLVTRQFLQSNSVIAGSPAKIIKENVNWDIRAPHQYAIDNNLN